MVLLVIYTPKNFMGELKEKIEDKVEEIIYKKAKEELEATARGYFKTFVDKLYSFFGWEETQARKIERLSKEIKDSKNIVLDDQVVGTLELFTLNYIRTIGMLMGVNMESDSVEEKERGEVEEDSFDKEKTI